MRKVLRHLRDLLEDSDVPRREVEARAGFTKGYLAQLLAGNIDLKYAHLIAVLRAAGVPAGEFFGALFPHELQEVPDPSHPDEPLDLPLSDDVVRLYSFGIESVESLRKRLKHCETALSDLHRSGALERRDDDDHYSR